MKKHISCRFNVNKKYSTCERVGDSPSIGNVDNGGDTEAIKKYYLHEYEEKSIRNCPNCWALRLCDICYADCYDQNSINVQMKAGYCEEVRERYKSWLIKYYETIENNIDLVKKIDDIEFN